MKVTAINLVVLLLVDVVHYVFAQRLYCKDTGLIRCNPNACRNSNAARYQCLETCGETNCRQKCNRNRCYLGCGECCDAWSESKCRQREREGHCIPGSNYYESTAYFCASTCKTCGYGNGNGNGNDYDRCRERGNDYDYRDGRCVNARRECERRDGYEYRNGECREYNNGGHGGNGNSCEQDEGSCECKRANGITCCGTVREGERGHSQLESRSNRGRCGCNWSNQCWPNGWRPYERCWSFGQVQSTCNGNDNGGGSNGDRERCERRRGYEWVNGQCVREGQGGGSNEQERCENRGDEYEYRNNRCINLREECERRGNMVWDNGECVRRGQGGDGGRERCENRGNEYEFRNNQCVNIREECERRENSVWENGECVRRGQGGEGSGNGDIGVGSDGRCDNVRRDWFSLSVRHRTQYVRALQRLISTNQWQNVASYHYFAANMDDRQMHSTVYFFPWHRAFIFEYEEQLRRLGGEFRCISLPYWDWSVTRGELDDNGRGVGEMDNTPFLTRELRDCGNGMICTPYGNIGPIPTVSGSRFYRGTRDIPRDADFEDNDQYIVRIKTDHSVDRYYDSIVKGHNEIHNMNRGVMSTMESPTDVLFMFHHSFVDKLLAEYQDCRQQHYIDSLRELDNLALVGLHSSRPITSAMTRRFRITLEPLSRDWRVHDSLDYRNIGGRGYTYEQNWLDWDMERGMQTKEQECRDLRNTLSRRRRRRGLPDLEDNDYHFTKIDNNNNNDFDHVIARRNENANTSPAPTMSKSTQLMHEQYTLVKEADISVITSIDKTDETAPGGSAHRESAILKAADRLYSEKRGKVIKFTRFNEFTRASRSQCAMLRGASQSPSQDLELSPETEQYIKECGIKDLNAYDGTKVKLAVGSGKNKLGGQAVNN